MLPDAVYLGVQHQVHSYQPKGRVARLGEIDVYVSASSQPIHPQHVLVILPDGFGHAKHNFVLADLFAEKLGIQAMVPDYFKGEGLPVELLKYRRQPGVAIGDHNWPEDAKNTIRNTNIEVWLTRHPHERIEELLRGFVVAVYQIAPNTTFLGIGYCFGGKYVFTMAKEVFKAAAAFHPSFVIHEDLKGIRVPIYVGLAGNDVMVPASLPEDLKSWIQQEQIQAIQEIYPNMPHGFAARPEAEDPANRDQFERALKAAVDFFQRTLAA
ncbi:uncharacterized protein A1O9_12703 [Exophiala aquamarina CBS 119918]|uniref:Dienelactone hydrolase domain-containing protein n=1 Tax=Exophiala aquamarina CBS 119918 TaxID=1182545 RepID=A0A072P6F9_9EURO|nr:uncharacterized protein A1O9_12703 [Exophiala aquamarina CBS 119918]KEF51200.1 hypothetical protein A1O9_12703 [Exophiala aquamarina CBS 119918]